jgi:hypothetical protein
MAFLDHGHLILLKLEIEDVSVNAKSGIMKNDQPLKKTVRGIFIINIDMKV